MRTCLTLWAAMLLAVVSAVPVWATTRYVSATGGGQYTLPSQAEAAAVSGDTILIGLGTYTESSGITTSKRLNWIGAGWDQTIITASSQWNINSAASKGTTIEGLRWESNFFPININSSADSITIRRCIMRATGSTPVISLQGGRLYMEDGIITLTTSQVAVNITTAGSALLLRNVVLAPAVNGASVAINAVAGIGTIELYNCVFLNFQNVFNVATGAQPVIAINNVFYDWNASPAFGTFPPASTFDYNASSGPAVPGTNGVVIAGNPFVNYDGTANYVIGTSDLHLIGGSNLINTGNPGLTDIDGSRSDFGVYGGPRALVDNGVPNYPWAVNIQLSPNVVGQGTPVNATAIGRVGPQY